MKRYRERMHTAPAAVHHSRNEKSFGPSREMWQTIRMFLNKTTFELGILGIICGAAVVIIVQHPYFQITDIRIEGLDTYASEIARTSIDEVRSSSLYGLPRNNYVLLQVGTIEKLLQSRTVLDSVELVKRFPHTLVVRAAEREVAFVVVSPNGVAYIADDGTLVRWYQSDEQTDFGRYTVIKVAEKIQNHGLRESILDRETVARMNVIAGHASSLHRGSLGHISIEPESETVTLQFVGGVAVVLRLDADIEVQMQKARLSSVKFPAAKKIDVRFADKVFVTF